MYTVYEHIFPNGKRYIGVTRNSVKKRWGYQGQNYKSQVVGRAIEKYGWDNIEHVIFCTCETKEQAEGVERLLVSYFDTMNPEHGYNVLPGGDVSVNDATPEMRYKLGNGNRGRPHTEEEKRKISDGCKRAFDRPESNGCIGKRASEETKAKMRESRRKYLENEENARAQSERAKAALEELWKDEKFKEETLARLTRYRRKKGEYRASEETKRKIGEANKGKWTRDNGTTAKRVVQLSKDGEYIATYGCILSAADAVSPKTVDSTARSIGKCCKHRPNFNTCQGFMWLYEEEYLQQVE